MLDDLDLRRAVAMGQLDLLNHGLENASVERDP